jgi:hypothetical protein
MEPCELFEVNSALAQKGSGEGPLFVPSVCKGQNLVPNGGENILGTTLVSQIGASVDEILEVATQLQICDEDWFLSTNFETLAKNHDLVLSRRKPLRVPFKCPNLSSCIQPQSQG